MIDQETIDGEKLEFLYTKLLEKGVDCDICDSTQLYFRAGKFRYEVCIPHEGNGFKWLYRKARIKGFDRWANSTDDELLLDTFDEVKDLVLNELKK